MPASVGPDDPIAACLDRPDAVLAIIAGVDGPSYRPLGASMAVIDAQSRVGSLSSGCVEADIGLHAMAAKEAGAPRLVKYGRGSPYFDIQLPCGGGLEILLLPNPDRAVLAQLQQHQAARTPVTLVVELTTGSMSLRNEGRTARNEDSLAVRFDPEPRFLVFGKGPEARTFAALVQAAGYSNLLLSPEEETLASAAAAGCATRHLTSAVLPADLAVDERTAIVLFFHDHDWEPQILLNSLRTPAAYVGAQGSRAARFARVQRLRDLGATAEELARLIGPIGLIPSARDPRTLAVSVLAEVLGRLKALEPPDVPSAPMTAADNAGSVRSLAGAACS